MPSKSTTVKGNTEQKYSTRKFKQCFKCGRNSGIVSGKEFLLCRICLRNSFNAGRIPGGQKASW